MLEQEYITQAEYDEAMADNVYERIASYNVETASSVNSYFVDALIEDVLNDLIEESIKNLQDEYLNAINLIFQNLKPRWSAEISLNSIPIYSPSLARLLDAP